MMAAEAAAAVECAGHWREVWARIVGALRACAETWNPIIAEHTGYATCLDWLQSGDRGEDWRFVTENVGLLQGLDGFTAEWFGVADAPITPAIGEVEQMLGAAA